MKRKLLLSFLLTVACIIAASTITAFAETYENLTYTVKNGEITIKSYSTPVSGELTIPSEIDGCPVTSIGVGAFKNCTSLTSVIIPDSVTFIDNAAFAHCTSLKSITVPDSVTSIGYAAFSGCHALKEVHISDLNAWLNIEFEASSSNPLDRAKNLYLNGALVTNIKIPDGTTSIGNWIFAGSSSLKSVTIPDSVTSIGSCAFFNCTSLESITIPDNVTSIGAGAFFGCSSLKSITIPDSVTSVGSSAFADCLSLKEVHISDLTAWLNIEFENFHSNPLYCAKSLYLCGKPVTNLVIPDGITTIGEHAFNLCSSFKTVTIPDSVTSIDKFAFFYCTSLEAITLPDSVTSIGYSAFAGCSSLWDVSLGNGVTSVGYGAFSECTALTGITIPDNVTSIGENAFDGCSSLRNVSLGDGVASIGYGAFFRCAALTDITIPNGVTSIDLGTFYGCTSLRSITIPDSVTSIGENAFDDCSPLRIIYYNGNVDDWDKIRIEAHNDILAKTIKKSVYYVTFLDENKNLVCKKMFFAKERINLDYLPLPKDCIATHLYTDEAMTKPFNLSTPITENLTLYMTFDILNAIEFSGAKTADLGDKGCIQKVTFATDKNAKYLSCTLKVPKGLAVAGINSSSFEIEQESETVGNDTYYRLFLTYNDSSIPTHQKTEAFELVLNVFGDLRSDRILTVEISDDASLSDNNGNSYNFSKIDKAEIRINPFALDKPLFSSWIKATSQHIPCFNH